MRILFDTNLLIAEPDWSRLPPGDEPQFYASALAYAELQEGEFSPDPEVRLRAPLDYLRATALFGEGLPFDDLAAALYRVVCRAVAESGRQVGRARRIDLMIAATALANDCALATRNGADFAGLQSVLTVIEL
ncbi:MAG: VapC toxin family PIN domain ribonuclease [Propionibacteriaceae bacterium]|jgi:predicted nucleic acid-binding protein|nr:VapC toxin family PIN domain ribonuclease [Propionibacteriaceae bacterium]